MASTMASVGENVSQFARRVLIITQNLPVPFDRHVWQEATELARHDYIVSVICPKGKGYDASYELLDSVHIFRHTQRFKSKSATGRAFECTGSLLWEFMLAGKVFFTIGFDAIHACNPPDAIFLIGGFFKLFFSKKFLFDLRNTGPELYEARFKRQGMAYKIMQSMERMAFKLADISIAANESYRQIATLRGRIPMDKVFVVRSGPSLEHMKIVPPMPSLKAGRKYLVGYSGLMDNWGGVPCLIEVARILMYDMKRDDIQFALVGDGPELGNFKKLAALQGVADCVTFTGLAPTQELLQVLGTADLCVAPNQVNPASEKSTLSTIMEYMALGKPIVQFDVTEGRFSAGDASLYASPNDPQDFAEKIALLLDNPAKRNEMGKIGRDRVENELAWVHQAPKLLAAYDALFLVPREDDDKGGVK